MPGESGLASCLLPTSVCQHYLCPHACPVLNTKLKVSTNAQTALQFCCNHRDLSLNIRFHFGPVGHIFFSNIKLTSESMTKGIGEWLGGRKGTGLMRNAESPSAKSAAVVGLWRIMISKGSFKSAHPRATKMAQRWSCLELTWWEETADPFKDSSDLHTLKHETNKQNIKRVSRILITHWWGSLLKDTQECFQT